MHAAVDLFAVVFAVAQVASSGTLAGRAVFDGVAPAPVAQSLASDPGCVKLAGASVQIQAVEVGANGGLQNTFVYLKSGVDPATTFDMPPGTVVLDQVQCQYSPRVLGVRVGQPFAILNSDPLLHNAHGKAAANPEFNIGQPAKGMVHQRTFARPEVMLPLTSDLHPWMHAFVGVVPHPFYAVTAADGSFTIAGIPPGEYTVEAWHEQLGTITRTIAIGPGQTTTESFTFSRR
jgi:hypothetical protein